MLLQQFSTEFIFTQDCSEPPASAHTRVSAFAEGDVEGASGPSASADTRVSAFAEGGIEGPRRFIFDLENISEHEKAAGAKSSRIPVVPTALARQCHWQTQAPFGKTRMPLGSEEIWLVKS